MGWGATLVIMSVCARARRLAARHGWHLATTPAIWSGRNRLGTRPTRMIAAENSCAAKRCLRFGQRWAVSCKLSGQGSGGCLGAPSEPTFAWNSRLFGPNDSTVHHRDLVEIKPAKSDRSEVVSKRWRPQEGVSQCEPDFEPHAVPRVAATRNLPAAARREREGERERESARARHLNPVSLSESESPTMAGRARQSVCRRQSPRGVRLF